MEFEQPVARGGQTRSWRRNKILCESLLHAVDELRCAGIAADVGCAMAAVTWLMKSVMSAHTDGHYDTSGCQYAPLNHHDASLCPEV
jgi:hypothetical protein